jgi:hypothetical protein
VRDADLAKHLRGEVENRQGLVIALDTEFGPAAHRFPPLPFAVRHC